jgi:peptidoglycan/xylan/chitin deacetylase (PgdA/CDA1 family)
LRNFAAAVSAPAVEFTSWRKRRLLVLGYHGVSLDDEDLWDGLIYMSPEMFRRRLRILSEANYTVLPLPVALQRLQQGTLPPRAITLVFDDGFHDFASVAAPILSEFGYPATVYLSSYYSMFNRPIFDIMLRYLLWKGSNRGITLAGLLPKQALLDEQGQLQVCDAVRRYAFENQLTGHDKDALLGRIAAAINIDYESLCRKRLLQTMNAEEVRAMKARGYDIQMHTHRHRVSRKRELFEREIDQNREWIQQTAGGDMPVHFSFPGGVWEPVAREWLVELGIETAMTCMPALADERFDKLRLPRFVDNSHISERTFRAWVAGSMSFFPVGRGITTTGQILEDTIQVSEAGSNIPASLV